MAEGNVAPESEAQQPQEQPRSLIDRLVNQYGGDIRLSEVKQHPERGYAYTPEQRRKYTEQMVTENSRIRELKENAKDQVSNQLAAAILKASGEDRSALINGIRNITGERATTGAFNKTHEVAHEVALGETVDLMARTMTKIAEAKTAQTKPPAV